MAGDIMCSSTHIHTNTSKVIITGSHRAILLTLVLLYQLKYFPKFHPNHVHDGWYGNYQIYLKS